MDGHKKVLDNTAGLANQPSTYKLPWSGYTNITEIHKEAEVSKEFFNDEKQKYDYFELQTSDFEVQKMKVEYL